MKLIVFFLSALMVGACTYNWDPEELECLTELNIEKSAVEDYLPFGKLAPLDNEILNKFSECSWKKQGFLHEDGTFDWDKFHELVDNLKQQDLEKNKSDSDEEFVATLTASLFKRMIDTCRDKDIHGDSLGQTAVKVQNCFLEEYKNLISDD